MGIGWAGWIEPIQFIGDAGGGAPATPLDEQIIAMIGEGEGAYYRISDLDTLFEDRGGAAATTPASVDGLVGTIKDKGPNARHLTSLVDDSARGTLRFIDGIYYIEGNGSTTAYASETLPSNAWTHYFAMAARRRSAANFGFQRRGGSTQYARLEAAATNNRANVLSRNAGGVGTVNGATNGLPVDTWAHLDGFSEVGNHEVAVDGGAYTSAAVATTAVSMTGALTLFLNTAATVEAVAADWAGGFYLNREPTVDERAIINLALNGLYDPSVLADLGLILE